MNRAALAGVVEEEAGAALDCESVPFIFANNRLIKGIVSVVRRKISNFRQLSEKMQKGHKIDLN